MKAITQSFVQNGYPSVPSGATLRYAARLVDELGNPVASTDLQTFILSVIDTESGDVINGVLNQDVLNVGGGTIDTLGNVEIILDPATTMLEPGARRGVRSMVMQWTYGGSGRSGRHQVDFKIEALATD